jgi:hypothetical protein
VSSLFEDMDIAKVMFGQAASKGFGCLTFQPLHEMVNDQGRIGVAVIGTLYVDADMLSKVCREKKLIHECVFGEVIIRPIVKRAGNALAGSGLAAIGKMHPDEIMAELDQTTHGEWPQPKVGK